QHVVLGRPETEIHALADTIDADLVVMGCHGRFGLALLLGSTANGVLHGTKCDVLAVRVGS
ncbi:MAG: universal stress protein UspA, partial [Gammaproteobacteria bacterium]